MSGTRGQIVKGVCDNGVTSYVPGVNCSTCGRFVGRDGYIEIECFEMSDTVASVSGECGQCLVRAGEREARESVLASIAAGGPEPEPEG